MTRSRKRGPELCRTAGTMMAGLDVSGDVIDECLNHKIESRGRRSYVRDRREAAQVRAFDALGARLFAVLGCLRPHVASLQAA